MSRAIEIRDVQGVTELNFVLPEGEGGIVVLRGDNGVGKTTALNVLDGMLTGQGRFRPNDAARRGRAEAFGRRLSVTSQNRYSGEVDVPSLGGRLSINDLVYPQAKGDDAKDRIRIKSLISLTGVKPDEKLFHKICGGKKRFEEIVTPDERRTEDLVELADRVRRAMHREARRLEGIVDQNEGQAKALREKSESLDTTQPYDADELEEAVEQAVRRQQSLIEQADNAAQAASDREEAEKRLKETKDSYDGPSVKKADQKLESERKKLDVSLERRNKLRAELERAELEVVQQTAAVKSANQEAESAARHERVVQAWTETLSQELPSAPDPAEIEAADTAVIKARELRNQGVLIRQAMEDAKAAEEFEKEAKEKAADAERLRESAQQADDVLSDAIPEGPLRVHHGRLVINSERRGANAIFEEESDGGRWAVAIPYVARAVGRGGYFVANQDAWQHLGTKGRQFVAEECRKAGIWMFTASVADGPLRPEIFDAETGEYQGVSGAESSGSGPSSTE